MKFKFGKIKNLTEMARIGFIPSGDVNGIEVYVHTDDSGNIPHFHVRKRSSHNGFEWESCVRYDSPEYFFHSRYNKKLDTKIAKQLDAMLRMVDEKDRNHRTYWEKAVDDWNDNNSSMELPIDIKQPDYTQLNN